ncbi:MAG: cell envelope biosis protein LolA [Alphaproteobacteria bacterium]|nr:cell envelope biosis protein LolA [Alphaproteobacteria bacterium]
MFNSAIKAGFYAALVSLFLCAPARAQEFAPAEQKMMLEKIQAYLNNITTMKAHFSQGNQDGTVDSGTFYLRRPGRLRFEYDAPKSDYIVADGLLVHYWDNGVKNYSNAPIGSTPADFLLRKKIKLSGDLEVAALRRPEKNTLVLTLVESKNPQAGDVRLMFSENPLQLQKWRVADGTGNVTEVSLSTIQTGIQLPATLFIFKPPKGFDTDWENTR